MATGTTAAPPHPPESWEPLARAARRARRSLERFLRIEAASGVVLIAATAVALFWANSRFRDSYTQLWHTPVGLHLGQLRFGRSLEWIVNEGLMVIFFFVAGLEIRREIHDGALSQLRRAALPVAAALGGMIAPAALYLALSGHAPARDGWGIPMATDIAFALGILTLLGKRVPASLRVLLLALAVIDDLGAIVVIAIFYSSAGAPAGWLVAALGVAAILAMQRFGVRAKLAYAFPALLVWAGIYAAGAHPTIAGVVVGLLTPVRAWLGREGFVAGVRRELEDLCGDGACDRHELAERLRRVGFARREAMSPSESLVAALHPWVAFAIMPLFALANAGVAVRGMALDDASRAVTIAVAVGLVVGKPVGVLAASFAAMKLGLAALPSGLAARHLVVLGIVAGIGFTMSLFIAQLAFAEGSPLLPAAKLGVLAASGVAAVIAIVVGRVVLTPPD